jgi:hypothetical protein
MNTTKPQKPVLESQATTQEAVRREYEAPRITRKHSLERVTLTSGTFAPGGQIGGD